MQRTLCQIRAAALGTGLFYLAGHEMPPSLPRRVYLCSQGNLELAPEFKITLSTSNGVNGYISDKPAVFAGTRIAVGDKGGSGGAHGSAGETFLIPVFHDTENALAVECGNNCFSARDRTRFSLVV